MVTPEQREKLEKYLLPRYTVDIIKILQKNNVNPDKVKPYDPGHICNVLKGKYDNAEIEAAFYELYEMRKAKKDQLTYNQNRLIANKETA